MWVNWFTESHNKAWPRYNNFDSLWHSGQVRGVTRLQPLHLTDYFVDTGDNVKYFLQHSHSLTTGSLPWYDICHACISTDLWHDAPPDAPPCRGAKTKHAPPGCPVLSFCLINIQRECVKIVPLMLMMKLLSKILQLWGDPRQFGPYN